MSTQASSYIITTTNDREIARLRMQADAMAADAATLFERIGVGPDWHCLDLACGCGGVTDLLSARLGPNGRVLGLDRDPALLAAALQWGRTRGLDTINFDAGDVRDTGLPRGSFDLVHLRFILSTAGHATSTLAEACALLRPGGTLAVQEPDVAALRCDPPHPAWDRLYDLLGILMNRVPDQVCVDGLYRRFLDLGLVEVRFRPFIVGFQHSDAMADYLPTTMESLSDVLLEAGLIEADALARTIADCRRHLQNPRTVSTSYLVAQVWGRKPD